MAQRYFHYCIRQGDTYATLAERFGLSQQALKQLNGSIVLRKNMLIRVPCAYGCVRGTFYAIRRGESLFRIAQRNGVLLDDLLAANPYLNPSRYVAGQVIVIPPQKKREPQAYYTLGEQEGLFDVLRKFHMDLTSFCMLNPDINPMNVKPGMRVGVLQQSFKGHWHLIAPGEDIVSVAQNHGLMVSELLCANENLRPSDFEPGRRVRIPKK